MASRGRSVVVVRRAFAARPARVFAAWCRPELMAQWFVPAPRWRADVTADVRIGGRYRVAMHDPAGGVHVQEGAYMSIEPDSRLVFTWTCLEAGRASVTTWSPGSGPRSTGRSPPTGTAPRSRSSMVAGRATPPNRSCKAGGTSSAACVPSSRPARVSPGSQTHRASPTPVVGGRRLPDHRRGRGSPIRPRDEPPPRWQA